MSECDDQVKSCKGHGGWFFSICSLPDYRSEPIMIAFSSLLVIGSGVANAGKLLREKKKKNNTFLLREFLKSKCSSCGTVEQSCCHYSTAQHPETESDVEKLAGGECLVYYIFIAT